MLLKDERGRRFYSTVCVALGSIYVKGGKTNPLTDYE